jgi:Fic family protein
MYIHQLKNFPSFTWSDQAILGKLGEVRNLQGRLMGRMESMGFALRDEAMLSTLTTDILKSSEIEGEILDQQLVRSSLAKRLGMDIGGASVQDRSVDGVVEMMLNATQAHSKELSKERLYSWHSMLFPTAWSSGYRIQVGEWRDDTKGPMQVVSGAMGKEKVHFEAPNAKLVDSMMDEFIEWFNKEDDIDLVVKAAIAHFWFVTIHPFDDGNGRIARALTDMLLARADRSNQRFYSMSAQIHIERSSYYDMLELSQRQRTLDITLWLAWFLECLNHALKSSEKILANVLFKFNFWNEFSTVVNERQRKFLDKVLAGWEGKITADKYRKINKVSQPTASRDLQDLIDKGIMIKGPEGGRSTKYLLKNQ